MKLYDTNGYIDMQRIININVPFVFVLSERAGGKTYGAIKYLIEAKKKFALMRRTQTQADMISCDELSPFKSPCQDMGIDYTCANIVKGVGGVYPAEKDSKGKLHISGREFAITIALSTIANIRGFDASDIEYLLYDEFIPEKTARPMKEEAITFFNAYETINRNRELQGRKPLKCVCLANSFDVLNPIFMHLKIVTKAMNMVDRGIETYIDRNRGFALVISQKSPIAEKKKDTALYNLVGKESDFAKFALQTKFVNENPENIRPCPIKEYRLQVSVGELSIYKHKSKNEYYVTSHKSGTPKNEFTTTDTDLQRFRLAHSYLWTSFLHRNVFFENYMVQALFKKFLKIS